MPVLANDASVLPSIDFVRAKFHYCPRKGILYKKDKYFKLIDGNPIGNIISDTDKDGYVRVRCRDKKMAAHRVIWAIYYGSWPDANLQIDHINRVRADNRINNLRLVTHKENGQNCLLFLKRGERIGKSKSAGGGVARKS